MSYLKNTAGQYLYFTLIDASDGTVITTGTVTGRRTIDGGTQATVTGTITHKGNGQWQLALSQADTNGDEIGFLFTHTDAVAVSIAIVTTTLTPALIALLSNLDAAVSSRSSHAAPNLSNLDAAVSSRLAAASYTAPNNAGIAENQTDLNTIISTLTILTTINNFLSALDDLFAELTEDDGSGNMRYTDKALEQAPSGTSAGGGDATEAKQDAIIAYVDSLETRLTATRAALLDNLANLDTAVSTRSSHSAPNLSNLDAAVSSRLAAASYTAPDLSNLDAAVSSRLAAASYTAPANATITSILTDTDFIQQLLAELITGSTPNRLFTALALSNAPSGGSGLAMADFFDTDSGETAATAVPGSVVGEIVAAISGGGVAGSQEVTDITINDGTSPIEGAALWITTDEAGVNVIWSGTTNASGQPKDAGGNNPFLDPGTYYIWVQLGGYTFSNPTTKTVS